MADLRTALAEMYWPRSHDHHVPAHVDRMLATPRGTALAALVDAAVKQYPDDPDWRCWYCYVEVSGYDHEPDCVVAAWLKEASDES